jgi:predicted ATPase
LETLPDPFGQLVQSVKITMGDDNDIFVLYEQIEDTIKNIELKAKSNKKYKNIILDIKAKEGAKYNNIKAISVGITSWGGKFKEIRDFLNINVISTFDNVIIYEGEKRIDEHVRTELDMEIFMLQKKYLDYQLNIGKKVLKVVSENNGENSQENTIKIKQRQERFLEIIDNLFRETGKKINRDKNEITFINERDEITAYQLSSGEKQILIILLTVLIQDNNNSILFMDEPEISLHFDWQKKLIQYIQELNPNAQIILATHSPAVIIEGWHNTVFNVSDLIVNNKTKVK